MAVIIQWHPMHALRSHTKISQNGHQTTFFNWMFAISIQISSSQKQNEGSNPPMIPYTCYIVLSLIKLINTGIWKTPGQLNVPASIHPYSQVWSRETVDSVGPQWVQQTVRRATESKIIWKKATGKKRHWWWIESICEKQILVNWSPTFSNLWQTF